MNSIAKSVVTNKFSSVGKSLGWDDNEEKQEGAEGPSAKELRKMEEQNAAAKAKRQEEHVKRNAEREKKREEIRAKYGIKEGPAGKNKRSGSTRKASERDDMDTETKKKADNTEEKQCHVM